MCGCILAIGQIPFSFPIAGTRCRLLSPLFYIKVKRNIKCIAAAYTLAISILHPSRAMAPPALILAAVIRYCNLYLHT